MSDTKRRNGALTCRCGERIILQTYLNGQSEWRHTAQRTQFADPFYCVDGHTARPKDEA